MTITHLPSIFRWVFALFCWSYGVFCRAGALDNRSAASGAAPGGKAHVDNSKVWRLGRFLCRACSAPVHSWATNPGLRPRLVYVALSALRCIPGLATQAYGLGWYRSRFQRFTTVMRVGKSRSRENVGLGNVFKGPRGGRGLTGIEADRKQGPGGHMHSYGASSRTVPETRFLRSNGFSTAK